MISRTCPIISLSSSPSGMLNSEIKSIFEKQLKDKCVRLRARNKNSVGSYSQRFSVIRSRIARHQESQTQEIDMDSLILLNLCNHVATSLLLLLSALNGHAHPTRDSEKRDLRAWIKTRAAFDRQPVYQNNDLPHQPMLAVNHLRKQTNRRWKTAIPSRLYLSPRRKVVLTLGGSHEKTSHFIVSVR